MSVSHPLSGPHTKAATSTSHLMGQVMLALAPATLFGFYLFGWPAVNLFLITALSAVLLEAVCLKLAGKPARAFLFDGSALLSGWLLALTLPPWAPWWIGVVGAFLAIVVGKQIFGGIGQNLFNPAMLARIALLVSFPLEMTTWITPTPLFSETAPGFIEGLAITLRGLPDMDGVSGATLLGHVKTEFSQGHPLSAALADNYSPLATLPGFIRGSLGETSAALILAGGAWLLYKRIITWHIPIAMLATVALLAAVFHQIDGERYPGPMFHLLTGGVMLGAFFIATDYVTSPNSRLGQIVFGAGCGLIAFVIRSFGSYPEGVGFAVLLMNAATPLIDHYIRPRIYGRGRDGKPIALSEPDRMN